MFRLTKQNIVVVMLCCYAAVLCWFAVLSVPAPIGADYLYHLDIAKFLARGDVVGAWNFDIGYIHFPYGAFVFQFLLVPTVWSGNPWLWARVLEASFMPLTYALSLWVMVKFAGYKQAAITGLVLIGCWSFMDGALQVRPESLDLLFYPLMLFALMTFRKKSFGVMALTTIYSHGPAAFSNIYGLAIRKLREKEIVSGAWNAKTSIESLHSKPIMVRPWRKTIIICALIAIPVLAVSVYYVGGALYMWGGASASGNPQELEFWTQPLTFIPVYAGATLLGVPFLFSRNKSEFESLLTWGFVGNLIMLPLWADRWLHYSSIPLAMLVGIGIAKLQGKKAVFVGVVVITLYMLYFLMFLHLSIVGGWWQPGQ